MLRANRSIELEHRLPPQSIRLRKDMFAVDNLRTIHNDDEAAQREGLAGAIAVGPQVAALIFRMMRGTFGEGWIRHGRVSLTFRRPIGSDDFITAHGRVIGKRLEGDSVRVDCEVWVETPDGVRGIVGNASATVP